MIESILYFTLWTLMLYAIHYAAHRVVFLKKFHVEHHRFVNFNQFQKSKWEWNNLWLYNDNRSSTIDLWITEVLPTLLFSAVTGQWWIFLFYYVWAAVFQELLEHRKGLDIPFLTCGDWHLRHHKNSNYNFGLFFPLWDKIFGTEKTTH